MATFPPWLYDYFMLKPRVFCGEQQIGAGATVTVDLYTVPSGKKLFLIEAMFTTGCDNVYVYINRVKDTETHRILPYRRRAAPSTVHIPFLVPEEITEGWTLQLELHNSGSSSCKVWWRIAGYEVEV